MLNFNAVLNRPRIFDGTIDQTRRCERMALKPLARLDFHGTKGTFATGRARLAGRAENVMGHSAKAAIDTVVTGHFLLDQLEPDELDDLLAYARVERYEANDVIFRKGDRGQSMMMVVDGRIKISASDADGKEVVLAILEKGELLGEMAILEEKARSADATAMEPSELVVLHKRDFIPFLERNSKVCIKLLTIMSDRLRRTSELVEDRAFLSFRSRLAKALLDLAATGGHEVAEGVRIEFTISQKDFGALLGASRESVNKQFQAWRSEGLIKLGRGFIILRRPDALACVVETC